MNKKSYSQILDHVARDRMAANTDLAPQIMERIQKGKHATMQPRTSEAVLRMRVFVTAVLILAVLVIGLVSVPGVRAAIQRWIGYVPGIGLVSEGQIRTLAEPVSVTRDGITLTVEEVWVDSEKTFIRYSVDGWTPDGLDAKSPGDGCLEPAALQVSDQELMLAQPQSVRHWSSGYELKSVYPSIPSTVDDMIFTMPCVLLSLPGQAPEGWEVSLHLIPAPSDAVFPVIEISTPTLDVPDAPPQTSGSDSFADGISLVLDRAVQMDDGYLIYATIRWESTDLDWVDLPDPGTLHVLDANGAQISYEIDFDATNSVQATAGPGQTPFAIKTAPVQIAGPLTLALDSVFASIAVDTSFIFDPGVDPRPGQVWELNQDIDVGHAQSLHVSNVTYDLADGTQAYLRFDMESETGITDATLFDKAHPLTGAGGGGGSYSTGPFTSDLYYLEPLPAGPLTISITSISLNMPGHWQTSWTPPVTQTDSSPALSACLTRESWMQALQTRASLPADLTGTLALFDTKAPNYYYEVSVSSLDGNDRKDIGYGFAPSLSPDGTRVVYIGPTVDGPSDGLYIMDLVSGTTVRLPGTARGDINPLWSPGGQMIAFTRGPSSGLIGAPGPYNLMVTNTDGSNLRQITGDNAANSAMAWMPDGNRILYTVSSQQGTSLRIIDIRSGESATLFDMNYAGTVAVSPDGTRLAFEEELPLDKYGLFVSDLNGTNRRLLADGDPYIVTVPAWSPDGNWVIATVHDPDPNQQANHRPALINVNTCQIVPAQNISGYITSWIR